MDAGATIHLEGLDRGLIEDISEEGLSLARQLGFKKYANHFEDFNQVN